MVLIKITQGSRVPTQGNAPIYRPMLSDTGENPTGFNLGVDNEAAVRILSAQNELIQPGGR